MVMMMLPFYSSFRSSTANGNMVYVTLFSFKGIRITKQSQLTGEETTLEGSIVKADMVDPQKIEFVIDIGGGAEPAEPALRSVQIPLPPFFVGKPLPAIHWEKTPLVSTLPYMSTEEKDDAYFAFALHSLRTQTPTSSATFAFHLVAAIQTFLHSEIESPSLHSPPSKPLPKLVGYTIFGDAGSFKLYRARLLSKVVMIMLPGPFPLLHWDHNLPAQTTQPESTITALSALLPMARQAADHNKDLVFSPAMFDRQTLKEANLDSPIIVVE